MPVQWRTLKNYILDGMLKDPEAAQFTSEQLLVWARWATVSISAHTAEATSLALECDGKRSQFPLPENMIGSAEKCGLIGYNDGKKIKYLSSIRLSPTSSWPTVTETPANGANYGYWEWPSGVLTLSFVPPAGTQIILNYFRAWEAPLDDDSVLAFPLWMEQPFAYMVAASACDPTGMQFSGINQWKRKQDSGTPESNPMHKQAQYFLKRAADELARYVPQDRDGFYRTNPRDVLTI